MHIMLDHTISVFVVAGVTTILFYMGSEVHTCTIPLSEKRLLVIHLFFNEFFRCS